MKLIPSFLAVAVVTTAACSEAFQPTEQNVIGNYRLETLISTDVGFPSKDWVAAGTTLTLTIAAGGMTTGHIFAPGAGDNGGDLDADLSGTWTLSEGTIRFSHTADTFLRDMIFAVGRNRLSGDSLFSGTRIQAVLVK
jgi:hypothetical protein